MRNFHYIIATALGLGYSPTAPGTAGTLLALLIAYFLIQGNMLVLILATALAFVIGTLSADYVERDMGEEDPSKVVIDEVAGMFLGLWFVPVTPLYYLIAFGLFRLFDVWKPFPIDSLQDINGGLGIMLDDIGAGVYTLIVIQLLLFFFN